MSNSIPGFVPRSVPIFGQSLPLCHARPRWPDLRHGMGVRKESMRLVVGRAGGRTSMNIWARARLDTFSFGAIFHESQCLEAACSGLAQLLLCADLVHQFKRSLR